MIPAFEPWADAWAAGIWRTSWQGTIVVALAWAIHRWCTFLSPRVLCWVWRLACLKLLVALCWSQPLELALLPAEVRPAPVRATAPRVMPPALSEIDVAAPGQRPQPALAVPVDPPHPLSWPMVLLPLWVIGVSLCVARTAQQWLGVRRLLRPGGYEVTDRLLVMCREEAARLGLRQLPRLHMAEGVDSPLLVGLWRPTILLPAESEQRFDENELRMMLAHELAHQARHDLAWNWLPTIAGWLFFFHPMVWLLVRRWSEAQEAACDELLIQRHAARTADLGRLLVKLAATVGNTPTSLTAPGVLGAYQNLERRIISMAKVKPFSARRLAVAGSLAALVGMTAIVPWRLVAQELPNVASTSADKFAQLAASGSDDRGIGGRDGAAGAGGAVQGADAPASRAIMRLRELGVNVDSGPTSVSIGVDLGFKGTAADLVELIPQVPNVKQLLVDLQEAEQLRAIIEEHIKQKRANPELLDRPLKNVDPTFLNSLKLSKPLARLGIEHASSAALAKIERLPACREMLLRSPHLSMTGWERFARLAEGTQGLQVEGKLRPTDAGPATLNDAALEHIARISSLRLLRFFFGDITDAGLPQLAKLEKLESFGLGGCNGVHGSGLAELSQVPSLRELILSQLSIDAAGAKAIGGLAQLETLTMPQTTIEPANADALCGLSNLRTLLVGMGRREKPPAEDAVMGNAIFRAAGQLPKLENLNAQGLAVGDDGLVALSATKSVERLSILPLGVTERGVQAIGTIRNLRWLLMVDSGLTDEDLKQLAGLEGLESLILHGSSVESSGLAALSKLKGLKELQLPDSKVNDEGCRTLATIASLEFLELSGTKITDTGLVNLARLENLQTLGLNNDDVSLTGLTPLANLKHLRQLSVIGLKAAPDDIAAMRTKFPGVTITNTRILNYTLLVDHAQLDEDEGDEAAPNEAHQAPAAANPDQGAAQRALARVKELGAFPANEKKIGIQGEWKGTDADLALIDDLPKLDWLYIDLERNGGSGLAKLNLKRTIEFVSLDALSDEMLDKIDRLPAAKILCLPRYRLTAAGFARLAELAPGLERLEVKRAYSDGGISDDGLAHVSKIQSLRTLEIFDGDISDEGLASLEHLDKLTDLELIDCWNIRGPGYAHLAKIKSLRMLKAYGAQIDARGLAALATLKQLTAVWLKPLEEPAAADVDRLRAALPNADILILPNERGQAILTYALDENDPDSTPPEPPPQPSRQQQGMAMALMNGAMKWVRRGDYSRAKDDYEHALSLAPAVKDLTSFASCNLAWLLATCPDDKIRDGRRAVELATRACDGFGWKGPNAREAIDTLAAAYAEVGDFAAAVKWQSEAISLAGGDEAFKKGAEERLALYRQQKAYRDQPQAAAPAGDRGAQSGQSLSFTPAPGGLAAPVQAKANDATVALGPDVVDSDLSDGHTAQYTETRTNRLRDGRQTAGLIRRVKVLGRFLMREEMKHTPGEGHERGDTNAYVHIIDAVQITNARKGVLLVLSPDNKTYEHVKEIFGLTDDGEVVTSKPEPQPNVDYYRQMREVRLETATELNDQFIDGKAANGFEVVQKIERPQGTDTWTRKYFVDPKTKLPLRIEVSFRSTDPDRGESDWVQSDIVFDQKLDPELFSTKAPEGYKELVRTKSDP